MKGAMAPARGGSYKSLRSCERPAITRFASTFLGGGRPAPRLLLHAWRLQLEWEGAQILWEAPPPPELAEFACHSPWCDPFFRL